MTEYTTPITSAFELQRTAINQTQTALEQSIEFQERMNRAAINGIEKQELAQRRGVELTQTAIHNYLDAIESVLPTNDSTVEDLRSMADEQFELLLENHADAYETVEAEFSEGADVYNDVSADSLEMLDEQLSTIVEVHEDLESQSVDAVNNVAEQVESLQEQVEDVQEHVQNVQEQAADAVEA